MKTNFMQNSYEYVHYISYQFHQKFIRSSYELHTIRINFIWTSREFCMKFTWNTNVLLTKFIRLIFHTNFICHYDDVIMTMLASQITSLPVVCSIVYSDVNQRKHQSSASLAFVREIHRGPVNFPHKWPVTRKMFPFDDVIMAFYTNFARMFY